MATLTTQEDKRKDTYLMSIYESWESMLKYKTDMFLWLFYNVFIGAIPIWFLFFIRWIASPSGSAYEPIIKGDLMIFLTSLSATSISIYLEITEEHFWDSRRVAFTCLVLVVIVSSMLFALLNFQEVRTALKVDDNAVINLSVVMSVLTVIICFHLFAMRFSLTKIEDFRKERNEKVEKITEEAKEIKKTSDGAEV